MGKIGSYNYPEVSVTKAIMVAETLVNEFHKEVKDTNEFANRLGHRSSSSGTFLLKMGDVRKFGLMDKRVYRATKTAEILANPKTPEEKMGIIKEMVFSIPLFEKLNNRLKTKSPTIEQFRTQLIEITGDREKGSKEGEKIRKIYIDAISHIKDNMGREEHADDKLVSKRKVADDMILFQSGELNISLPKNSVNIDVLITILQNLKKDSQK